MTEALGSAVRALTQRGLTAALGHPKVKANQKSRWRVRPQCAVPYAVCSVVPCRCRAVPLPCRMPCRMQCRCRAVPLPCRMQCRAVCSAVPCRMQCRAVPNAVSCSASVHSDCGSSSRPAHTDARGPADEQVTVPHVWYVYSHVESAEKADGVHSCQRILEQSILRLAGHSGVAQCRLKAAVSGSSAGQKTQRVCLGAGEYIACTPATSATKAERSASGHRVGPGGTQAERRSESSAAQRASPASRLAL